MDDLEELSLQSKNKHFVFVFGASASGKSVVIGSMLQAMQRPTASSKLTAVWDGIFYNNQYSWQIFTGNDGLAQGAFPRRTKYGKRNWVHVKRSQKEEIKEELVFWELGDRDNWRDDFFGDTSFLWPEFIQASKCSTKSTFLITVDQDKANRDDLAICDFLNILIEFQHISKKSQIVFLITKRDKNDNLSVDELCDRELPLTMNCINQIIPDCTILLNAFSVGSVCYMEGMPVITATDYQQAERLFERITQTGKHAKTWWNFLLKFA